MTSRALERQFISACAGCQQQDCQISEQCGGSTWGKSCVIGEDTQDGLLVCVQDAQAQGDNGGALVRVQCVDSR
jgi:hypothetical protein